METKTGFKKISIAQVNILIKALNSCLHISYFFNIENLEKSRKAKLNEW